MKLHLPQLGEIDATLRIQGQSVHLDLLVQQNTSVTSLRSQIPILQQALQDSGLQLTQFKVQHGTAPDGNGQTTTPPSSGTGADRPRGGEK